MARNANIAELYDLLQPSRPTAVVDIGANPIDGSTPYAEMLAGGLCKLVGFEPLPQALAALERRKGRYETYLPFAIGEGGEQVLRVTAAEGMSSLLAPDPETLELFTDFTGFGKVQREQRIETRRLDDIVEVENLDLLKIDIQGGELGAIRSGLGKLSASVAIQIEVSFVPLYSNQPALGESDQLLRQMGFLPHCLVELKTWPLAPFRAIKSRQLLEADMLYVRDFRRSASMTGEQWKHLALIAHHCYRSTDLAMLAIRAAVKLGAVGADAPQRYVEILNPSRKKPRK